MRYTFKVTTPPDKALGLQAKHVQYYIGVLEDGVARASFRFDIGFNKHQAQKQQHQQQ